MDGVATRELAPKWYPSCWLLLLEMLLLTLDIVVAAETVYVSVSICLHNN